MATLAQWSLTTNFSPTTTGSNVTPGDLTNGSLSSFTREQYLGYASDPVLKNNPANSATNIAGAITYNSYCYFQLSANAGFHLNLAALAFNCARGGATTPRGYGVRTSIDTYGSTIATADIGTARTTWTAVNIDLSGASYQGISTITFRLYVYGPNSGNSSEFDDITITGTAEADAAGLAIPVILNQYRMRRT